MTRTLDAEAIKDILCVVMSDDLAVYAHDLYHTLHALDKKQLKGIVIEDVGKCRVVSSTQSVVEGE